MADLNVNALLRGLEFICSNPHGLVKQKMDVVVSLHDSYPPDRNPKHNMVIGVYPADWHAVIKHDESGNKYGLIRFGSSTHLTEVAALGLDTAHYRQPYYTAEELIARALCFMVLFETMPVIQKVCKDASLDNSL